MLVDLADDQLANLRWLLQAIGGDVSTLPIAILTVLDSGWAANAFKALPDPKVPPSMTLDDARIALGRFAADNATVQQVADLKAVINDQNTEIVKVQALLTQLQGVATDVTAVAATPLAQEVAAIQPVEVP